MRLWDTFVLFSPDVEAYDRGLQRTKNRLLERMREMQLVAVGEFVVCNARQMRGALAWFYDVEIPVEPLDGTTLI